MRRFNAKCARCGRGHSMLATEARRPDGCHEIVTHEAFVHGGAWLGPQTVAMVDVDGFKHLEQYGAIARVCECGAALRLIAVRGRLRPEKKCDARCTHATGHSCECACGGKNHGAANAA